MAYRGYKYRLYPDSGARAFFARCFGATRYCYNYCVREYDKATAEGRQLSGFDIAALLREHTKNLAWMANVDYEIKESAPHRFDNALGKFKRREANRPREHKKGERSTISYTTGGVIKVDFKHDLVQLPKIGVVKARLHRTFIGEIVSATIKREADGNYYISLAVSSDDPCIPQKQHTEAGTVGIDVGLRHLATLSDGTYIDLPDTHRIVARIQFLKKRLERQTEGSKRYYRTKLQIARLYHRMANITKDAHRKAAVKLCNDHDTICMETLNVAGMKRGQRGEKTAGDVVFNAELRRTALGLFIDRVKRKAADTGTNFVSIDRFEPSTKTCSHCGYVLPAIDLDTKEWTCPECGTHHDRDINAAINIRRKGIEQLQASQPKASHKETLPPAEGNVKPAKKATAGCDLRTGKMTAKPGPRIKTQLDRQPKAQIADGTAPPRFFREPAAPKPPLPPDHPFRYFKISSLGNMVGKYACTVKRWIEESRFIDPAPEDRELTIKLLKAIKQVAASLRELRMTEYEPAYTSRVLSKMNKVVHVDWILKERLHFDCTFSSFRVKRKSAVEIYRINEMITVDFANRLDAVADRYLRPLLPQSELHSGSVTAKAKRPLRRGSKNASLITPLDDPMLISYEELILPVVRFFYRYCHVSNNTLDDIIGEGTTFRPQNCTRAGMTMIIDGLNNVADTISVFDYTIEGQKERLEQFFHINEKYVNLTEIARRYIGYDKANYDCIYFSRRGTRTRAFYNEHYHEIMRFITYELPRLIRDCAGYLSTVYKIKVM